jgi:NAD(P)-dependent dehydrogenase (short-subunit alcohol dehydrogenase family)
MTNLFALTDKVIAVIGAGSGIGAAIAAGAADQGATVVCFDIKRDGAGVLPLDIRDSAAVERALGETRHRNGRLDGLVCTPAINVRKKILDYKDEELDRVLELNVKGNFNVLRAAGRIMTADRRGSIVLFSSIRSQTVEPGQSVYAATKAAIVQMARTAAAEFGPFGVRVNAVAPGVIETPLTAPIKANEAWYKAYADKTVFKRWGRAEEMVGPTLFLISDAASYVTGTLLVADGGWLAADGRFTPPGM